MIQVKSVLGFIRKRINKIFIVCFTVLLPANIASQGFNIYSDFPSGNILIEKIKNDTVWMRPDLRDTQGGWFYWCFATDNAKDKTLTFLFTKSGFTVMGPAVSYDSGLSWDWLNTGSATDNSFIYTFKTDAEVRFSMGMPYTQKNFSLFINPLLNHDNLKLSTLTKTKSGRDVEQLIIKPSNSRVKYKVLITARHHACEMMANYEIEGIIEEILNDEWLKNNVEFCFIPFIDKDGVENGDQGKNRIPRDHNRDYRGESIYESTAALRNWVPGWAENKLAVCMDLHCPGMRGGHHESIQIVGSDNVKMAEQQKLFCGILKTTNKSELKISENLYLPFGTAWNTSKNTTQGLSFARWASTIEGVKLTFTLELPYANNEGQSVNQTNARTFGNDLAKAIKMYLMEL